MGTWTENWKATHAGYVRKNKGVKSVMEHRNVEGGEIYCVGMTGGGFEVRRYEGETLKTSEKYPSGAKAVLAYRALRDKRVPNRSTAKTAKPKATPKKKTPAKTGKSKKVTTKAKSAKKGAAKK